MTAIAKTVLIAAVSVVAICLSAAAVLFLQNRSLRAENRDYASRMGTMTASIAAQNATITELRGQGARVDRIVGEWAYDRDSINQSRAALRRITESVRRMDRSFSDWGGAALPAAVRPGGGLLGTDRNGTRAASGAGASAGSAVTPGPAARVAGGNQ